MAARKPAARKGRKPTRPKPEAAPKPDVSAKPEAAAELAGGTIETVLAKSDLELGIEALMRGLRP